MNEKHAFFKNTRIVFIFSSFFIFLTTTAAVAASVTLRWDPNDPAPEGYRVFARKSDQAYSYSQPDWEGSGVTCTINLPENQTEYCFVVRAFDGNLESVNSEEVQYMNPASTDPEEVQYMNSASTDPVTESTPIALGRPAFASSTERSGLEATRAFDGSSTTRWSSTHSDNQWIYVDLGAAYTINRVVLDWETAYGGRYEIQVSDDAVVWNTVYTEFNGDGDRDDISLPPSDARYVRMRGIQRATPWGYSLFDFKVYGAVSSNQTPDVVPPSTETDSTGGSSDEDTAPPPPTETASTGGSSDEDTTPPVWDGATDGAGLVTGNTTGGSVTVEFDTAGDVVDDANLRYNVYYAESSSWDNVEWNGNDVVADAAVRNGDTFAYAVTINGLLNDVSYTFGVRAEDQSGNEDTNSNTLTATPAVSHVGNFDYELALNRPAFASSTEKGGVEARRAVDGSSTTRWSSNHSDPQWIYVDLGAAYTINRVVLDWETAYGRRYEIQVSDDAVVWNTVYTQFNGDGDRDDISLPPTDARYVRMRGIQRATPWGYSLFDFKVYGAVSSNPATESTPIALGRPAFASSTERSGLEARRAVDGSSTTRWASAHSDPQWIYVDLGAAYTINRVVLDWETAYGARYEIQVSDDAVVWNTVYTEFNGDGDRDDIPLPPSDARYVRMRGIQRATPWGYSLFAFEVYGFNR